MGRPERRTFRIKTSAYRRRLDCDEIKASGPRAVAASWWYRRLAGAFLGSMTSYRCQKLPKIDFPFFDSRPSTTGMSTLVTTPRFAHLAMLGLANKLPFPAVVAGAAVLSVFTLLKLKDLVTDVAFSDKQARYRKCNRCAKKGAKVRCTRCRRAYYCSRECLKAAWKLEICECC